MDKKRNINDKSLLALLVFTLTFMIGSIMPAQAVEKWDKDYFAYGSGLSETQLADTKQLLGLPEDKELNKIVVSGSDYKQFTGMNMMDSSMYSSAVIQKTKEGSGVQVFINTPNNITEIKDHQYMNAALTSGISDANIIVGSPIPVTGESALIGVYKAFEDAGYEINEEATKVATDELSVVNEISQDNEENDGFDSKDLSLAINEMKKKISEISDKSSITIEDLTIIVNNALNDNNISISEENKEKLVNWLNDFKELDIDWNLIKEELSELTDLISKKAEEVYKWGQESGFFAELWQSIKDFFKSLFN